MELELEKMRQNMAPPPNSFEAATPILSSQAAQALDIAAKFAAPYRGVSALPATPSPSTNSQQSYNGSSGRVSAPPIFKTVKIQPGEQFQHPV